MTTLLKPTTVWVYRVVIMHRAKPGCVARCDPTCTVDSMPHATVTHDLRPACQPHVQ